MTLSDVLVAVVDGGLSDEARRGVARVAGTIAIVLVTIAVRRFARRGVRGALTRWRASPDARLLVDRVVQVGILIGGATWVADLYGLQLGALGTLLGITGVAIGLAIQDVLKQLIAGMYLMIERPFTLGDRVVLASGVGVVRRIELLATVVHLRDGDVVVVPNAWFLANVVVARSPSVPNRLRFQVRIRATHAAAATAHALHEAVESCARRTSDVPAPASIDVWVRAWDADGPVVSLVMTTQRDRDLVVNDVVWALREQFGDDLIEMKEE